MEKPDAPVQRRAQSREADRCLTTCPKCHRAMQARWLRYAHHCRGDFEAREQEAVSRAHEAFRQREASQKAESAAATAPKNAEKYARLLGFARP